MRNSLSWVKISIVAILIFSIVLFFSHEYLLRQIGHFLVLEQKPQKSDIIVVLNGRDTERSLAAVDMYKTGYGKLIVIARGPKQPGCGEFWKRVGKDFNSKVFFQRSVEAMGIPRDSFMQIGEGVHSTFDEAKAARTFLKEKGYKSILLVTSKWHSRRAYLTFTSVFGENERVEEIRITCHPSKYDTFNPDAWWKNEAGAEIVLGEYLRLIYYILTFRISPLA
jgi:uncharacterized SAM-binding protein YcdF (DUF218 family)